ncbi:fungal-specific transcription factor domain-containing protein [Lipomyces arxii]|uniref:fungal-specific transcription factor domain-containing protein n=1 Tax=Lipomyces arxii TaxID=56418 RepID=UPI0034CF97CF
MSTHEQHAKRDVNRNDTAQESDSSTSRPELHHGGSNSGNGSKHSHDKRKLVIACNACRKKKVKCSGDRPACGNCLRLNVPCQYPAVKNRGSRFGYHEMLSRRLEMMERHIKPPPGTLLNHYHSTHKLPLLQQATNNVTAQTVGSIPLPSAGRAKRTADGVFKRLGYGQDSYEESAVDSDLIHSLTDTAGNSAGPSNESDSPNSSRDRQPSLALVSVHIPDFEIIEHLTELYFRYLNNQSYAFLHKPTFMPRLRAGQVNPLLVLAVCAVSARFSRHPKIMTQPRYAAGEPFLQEARKLLSQEFDEPTVETTQALHVMGFSDFCGLNGGRAAIYSGLSMRMAATLGLNKEMDDPNVSWIDREIRRKTWWSVLVLDRLAHSGPKRSFLLMEEECQVQLPASEHAFLNGIPVVTMLLTGEYPENDPELPREPLDLPAYHVKAVVMWGHIATYVNMGRKKENFAPWTEYSEFHQLEREIDSFYASLPPHLVYSRDNLVALDATQQAGTFVHMHVAIQQCLIALHRCIYPYDHSNSKFEAPPISFIERSANKLTAAACAISGILNDTLQIEDVLPAAFVGFGAYNSATVHIVNAFSNDQAISMMAKKHLTVNLKFLVLMREYWAIAGGWCTTLKDRYFQKLQSERNPDVWDRTSAVLRPPSPTVRYGTLEYAGRETTGTSPSAARSDSGGSRTVSSPAQQPQAQQPPAQQPPPPQILSPRAIPPEGPILSILPQPQQQQQVQSYSDTLTLPATFPPIEDERPNPFLYEFDEAWLRALENNKDQIVIDTDRVGENSLLDFGSANWFIDMPAQTLPPGALADPTQVAPQQMMVQQDQVQQNSDSFFTEIFGDAVWDMNGASPAQAALGVEKRK